MAHLLIRLTLLGTVPLTDWCPDCLLPSMLRVVYVQETRGAPSGVTSSAPVCRNCGRVGP